jgi:hypothetical protein
MKMKMSSQSSAIYRAPVTDHKAERLCSLQDFVAQSATK